MVSVQIKQNSIPKIPDYNVTSPQNEEKESACSSEAHTKVTTRQSYVGCQNWNCEKHRWVKQRGRGLISEGRALKEWHILSAYFKAGLIVLHSAWQMHVQTVPKHLLCCKLLSSHTAYSSASLAFTSLGLPWYLICYFLSCLLWTWRIFPSFLQPLCMTGRGFCSSLPPILSSVSQTTPFPSLVPCRSHYSNQLLPFCI